MSLEKSLVDLDEAFARAAQEIKKQYPEIWAKVADLYDDPQVVVQFLRTKHMSIGESPLTLLQSQPDGREVVRQLLDSISNGLYV